MKTTLDECIDSLGNNIEVLTKGEEESIVNEFEKRVKIEIYGIDWKEYPDFIEIKSADELLKFLPDQNCYILWDEFSTPVVKSALSKIIDNIDDVTAVSFDTYLFDLDFKWFVEFHHEDGIRLEIFDNSSSVD